LDTEQIQHHVTNIQQEYIVCEIISYQFQRRRGQKKLQKNIFCWELLSIFFRICGFKPSFAVENPQKSVWLDWLSAQQKIANSFLYAACVNPAAVKLSAYALYPLLETLHSTHSINIGKHPNPTSLGQVYKRALVVPPLSSYQQAFVCGACAGTTQVGVLLVSLFDPLFKRSRLHCLDVCLTWHLWLIKVWWQYLHRQCGHHPGTLPYPTCWVNILRLFCWKYDHDVSTIPPNPVRESTGLGWVFLVVGSPLFLTTKYFMGCPLPPSLTLKSISVGVQGTKLQHV